MRVLVDPRRNTVHDLVEDGAEFAVAPPLQWRDVPPGFDRRWSFDGTRFTPPTQRNIEEARREALDAITAARNRTLKNLTVTVDGATFDADEASVARMSNAVAMLDRFQGDPRVPATITWLDHDNVPRNLAPAQLAEVAAQAWLATQQVWGTNHALKIAIESARTLQQIAAVRWEE